MTDKVPAKRESAGQPAFPQLDMCPDFGAMPAPDVAAWTMDFAPRLSMAERITEEARRQMGKALWELRRAMPEANYAEHVRAVAQAAGVTATTVGRWRTAAERHENLPPASKRTESARERSLTTWRRKLSTGSQQEGPAPDEGNLSVGDPAPAAPEDKRTGVKGQAVPKASTPAPPADEVPIDTAGNVEPVDALTPRRVADEGWEACPRCRERPGFVRKSGGALRMERDTAGSGCAHPAVRRNGRYCSVCGALVGYSPLVAR